MVMVMLRINSLIAFSTLPVKKPPAFAPVLAISTALDLVTTCNASPAKMMLSCMVIWLVVSTRLKP